MNTIVELSQRLFPGEILLLGALLVPLFKGKARNAFVVALPVLSALQLLTFELGFEGHTVLFGHVLDIVRVDRLSRIFGLVFHVAAIIVCIYSWHVKRAMDHMATLVYAGSAIAAVFAGDLISLFIFWELTALSSVFLIFARGLDDPSRKERAYRAGMRYLLIQVASGVLLLAGAILYSRQNGTLNFEHMWLGDSLSENLSHLTSLDHLGTTLIFLAFGIKAAFPLLHNWVQDAYPEATVSGTVVLASFTTKLAIYALARGFAGTDILIPIGAVMTVFPIFFAVIENDLRRVLAYSLNNQLGYMIVGIGIGTQLALNGAAAHAFAHILYKGLLLMSVGAVLFRTGTADASRLGGLHKSMPITTVFCIIGALAISAFPLFSGFVTKSMIVSATGAAHMTVIFGVLLFASAGVCDHSGIKVPFFAFFAHDQGWRVPEAPRHMLIAMGIAAAFCIGVGLYPAALYALLPYPEVAAEYHAYDQTHIFTMLELLIFAGIAFIAMVRLGLYPPELPRVNLDFDVVYRRWLPTFVHDMYAFFAWARTSLWRRLVTARDLILMTTERLNTPPYGTFGQPWKASTTTLLAALLLGLMLLSYYS